MSKAGEGTDARDAYLKQHGKRMAADESKMHTEPRADVASWMQRFDEEEEEGEEEEDNWDKPLPAVEENPDAHYAAVLRRFKRLEHAFYLDIPQHPYWMMRYLIRLQDLLELALNPRIGWLLEEDASRVGRGPGQAWFTIGQGEEYLWRLLARIRKVRTLRLKEMGEFPLFGPHAKYNQMATMLDVECKILLLIATFPPPDHNRLVKMNVVARAEHVLWTLGLAPLHDTSSEEAGAAPPPLVPKPGWLLGLGQWAFIELMQGLCAAWNRLEPSLEALSDLLNALQLRLGYLMFWPEGEGVLDGKYGVHRVKMSLPENASPEAAGAMARLFRCSAEFISDMACTFASLWRSVHVAELLFGEANAELDASEPIECVDLTPTPRSPAGSPPSIFFSGASVAGPHKSAPVWEKYRVREADTAAPRWMTDQLSNSNQQGFYDKLKRTLSTFSIHPGERERHTRGNSNTEALDPTAVLEHCRTPAKLDLLFSAFKFEGVSQMLRGQGWFAGLLRTATMLKVLDGWFDRVTNSRFDFWANCVVMERDLFASLDATLEGCDEPTLVQCMGELNVLIREQRVQGEPSPGVPPPTFIQVYRTRRPERALLLWAILVVERRRGLMRRKDAFGNMKLYKMDECRELLRAWCPGSYAEKYQRGGPAQDEPGRPRRGGRRRRRPGAAEDTEGESDMESVLDAVTSLNREVDRVRSRFAPELAQHTAQVDEFC